MPSKPRWTLHLANVQVTQFNLIQRLQIQMSFPTSIGVYAKHIHALSQNCPMEVRVPRDLPISYHNTVYATPDWSCTVCFDCPRLTSSIELLRLAVGDSYTCNCQISSRQRCVSAPTAITAACSTLSCWPKKEPAAPNCRVPVRSAKSKISLPRTSITPHNAYVVSCLLVIWCQKIEWSRPYVSAAQLALWDKSMNIA